MPEYCAREGVGPPERRDALPLLLCVPEVGVTYPSETVGVKSANFSGFLALLLPRALAPLLVLRTIGGNMGAGTGDHAGDVLVAGNWGDCHTFLSRCGEAQISVATGAKRSESWGSHGFWLAGSHATPGYAAWGPA